MNARHPSLLMLATLVGAVLFPWGCGGDRTLTGAGGNMAGGIGGLTGTPANPTGLGAIGGIAAATGGIAGATGSVAGASGGDPFAACFNAGGPAKPLPPDILIALDASASMNTDMSNVSCSGGCGAQSKWAAAVAAINSSLGEPTQVVTWGIELFGMDTNDVCGAFEGSFGPALAIQPTLNVRTSANGGVVGGSDRPTRGAVAQASRFLMGLNDFNTRYIVLVTDGVPGCATSGSSADDTGPTVDAIATAATYGIPTYVVGIATAGGPAHDSITRMARAGVGGVIGPTGAMDYFAASTGDDIRQALTKVVYDTAGCTFAVPQPPQDGVTTRDRIWVSLNGVEIPHDYAAGWEYVDGTQTRISLHGASCTAAKGSSPAEVSIRFRCPLI